MLMLMLGAAGVLSAVPVLGWVGTRGGGVVDIEMCYVLG